MLNIFPSNPSQKWSNSHLLYAQMGQIGTLVRRIVPWDSPAHFRDCHVGYISVQFRPNWSIGRDFVQDSSMSILDIFLSDPHQKWSNGRLLYVGLCHRIVQHTSRIILDIFRSYPRQNGLMFASCMAGCVKE